VLRLVQQGPEDRVAQEDPGKKAETLNQMLMIEKWTFMELPNASVDFKYTEKNPATFHLFSQR